VELRRDSLSLKRYAKNKRKLEEALPTRPRERAIKKYADKPWLFNQR
jgi:hypothetical protein